MSHSNQVRDAWETGRAAFGVWLSLPGAEVASWLSSGHSDFLCVDQQHGLIGYSDFVAMTDAIVAMNCTPVTRVPSHDAAYIGKVLDSGARGVVVPMVESAAQAGEIVRAVRYPPAGSRSYGPLRITRYVGSREPKVLEADPVVLVMIESEEGIRNVEEIARTPGIDGIYIGPADLAIALGLPPALDKSEPRHVAAVKRIKEACDGAGIAAGIQCGSGESAREYAEKGFKFITVTKDSSLLQEGVSRELLTARGSRDKEQFGYS